MYLRKVNIALALLFVFIICLVAGILIYDKTTPKRGLGIDWKDVPPSLEETLCLCFIEKALGNEWGIFTNFIPDSSRKAWATGHQILSESEGLMMLYAVQAGDKTLFDQHFNFVTNMLIDDGVIAWRIDEDGTLLTGASASIDDLRIIRALFFAHDRWGDDKYKIALHDLVQRLKKYELTPLGLVDYYDASTKKASTTITLSYIDLYTMDLLAQTDATWARAAVKGRKIIEEGVIAGKTPFYHQSYDYKTKSYLPSEEINIIDFLKIILHLSEVQQAPQQSIDWLWGQLNTHGALYNNYRADTGQPANGLQSSAAYALACRIATNINDPHLYKAMYDRLISFQIRAKDSALHGAWGDLSSQRVYSFDNLQALLALQAAELYRGR